MLGTVVSSFLRCKFAVWLNWLRGLDWNSSCLTLRDGFKYLASGILHPSAYFFAQFVVLNQQDATLFVVNHVPIRVWHLEERPVWIGSVPKIFVFLNHTSDVTRCGSPGQEGVPGSTSRRSAGLANRVQEQPRRPQAAQADEANFMIAAWSSNAHARASLRPLDKHP